MRATQRRLVPRLVGIWVRCGWMEDEDYRMALAWAGLMDVETFLSRTQPKKRFKSAWWGEDLIQAVNSAPALGEGKPAEVAPALGPIGKARRATSPTPGVPIGLERIDPGAIK